MGQLNASLPLRLLGREGERGRDNVRGREKGKRRHVVFPLDIFQVSVAGVRKRSKGKNASYINNTACCSPEPESGHWATRVKRPHFPRSLSSHKWIENTSHKKIKGIEKYIERRAHRLRHQIRHTDTNGRTKE